MLNTLTTTKKGIQKRGMYHNVATSRAVVEQYPTWKSSTLINHFIFINIIFIVIVFIEITVITVVAALVYWFIMLC